MSTPVLHVLAGPNGSGKSTFAYRVLGPQTQLDFVNADAIARARWPGEEEAHAYEAARAAAAARAQMIADRRSFIAETVFSHRSKVELVEHAIRAGYRVEMHVMLVPEDLAVARVEYRAESGGHTVPDEKIRERYHRLWPLVAEACGIAHQATFYDNSAAHPALRIVALHEYVQPVGEPDWPLWTPRELTAAQSSQ